MGTSQSLASSYLSEIRIPSELVWVQDPPELVIETEMCRHLPFQKQLLFSTAATATSSKEKAACLELVRQGATGRIPTPFLWLPHLDSASKSNPPMPFTLRSFFLHLLKTCLLNTLIIKYSKAINSAHSSCFRWSEKVCYNLA